MNYFYTFLLFIAVNQVHACNLKDELVATDFLENASNSDTMEIKITINSQVYTATLNNSSAAKDFASLLPMTLNLDDYAQTEKVGSLSKQLNISGSPSGCDPDVGDITYYAPWGNLAIFYKDFGYAEGLIKLGKIKGDMSLFKTNGKLEATFEIIE